MKEIVAKEIAQMVKSGETIGVGTGSTVDLALINIGERVRSEGLKVRVVPSSYQSAWRCQEIGLDVLYPGFNGSLACARAGVEANAVINMATPSHAHRFLIVPTS